MDDGWTLSRCAAAADRRNLHVMSPPQRRAAAAAAIGALTEHLLASEAGTPRSPGAYLSQLVDEDGAGALAQGYYGLLDLSALLLTMAAQEQGLEPRELLTKIALHVATEPDA